MEKIFTRKEAAEYLRISVVSLDRYRKQGKLSYYQFGRCIKHAEKHLIAFSTSCEIAAKTNGGDNDPNV